MSHSAYGAGQANPFAGNYDLDTTYIPPEIDAVNDSVVPAVVPAVAQTRGAPAVAASPPKSDKPVLQFTDSNLNNSYVSGNIGSSGQVPAAAPPAAWSAAPPPRDTSTLLPGGAPSSSAPPPPPPGRSNDAAAGSASYPFWSVRRYRQYFDVESSDVLWRVTNSLAGPFKHNFMEKTEDNPDVYGPFWTATTLVFVTAVAGNYANYIAWHKAQAGGSSSTPPTPSPSTDPTTQQWFNDYGKMGWSALLFYGYTFVLSLALFFALRYFKAGIKLSNVWCIYGYSLTIFVPISFICIVPLEAVRWSFISAATVSSGLFLFLNLKETIYEAAPAKASVVLLAIALAHIGMGLALKLYFFQY